MDGSTGQRAPDGRLVGRRSLRRPERSADLGALAGRLEPFDRGSPRRAEATGLIPLVAIGLAILLIVVFAVVVLTQPAAVLKASSVASGTSAEGLLTAPLSGSRPATWRSSGTTVGTMLSFDWSKPVAVDRIRWRAPATSSIRSALVRFGDGSQLLLSSDVRGDVDASFPSRRVRRLDIVVSAVRSGTASVGMSALRVDASGAGVDSATADDTEAGLMFAASTSAAGTSPAMLAGSGASSSEWTAAADDGHPWVELRWPSPRQVTSVRLQGADAKTSTVSGGVLRFSDGSTVPVGEVRRGDGLATVVGFAPRMTTSVRFTVDGDDVSLKAFSAAGVGSAPAPVPTSGGQDIASIGAARCSSAAAPDEPPSGLVLLCPATGSTVDGAFTVAVAGPASRDVSIEVFQPFPGSSTSDGGVVQVVQQSRTTRSGIGRFRLDASKLPGGPLNLAVRMTGVDRPLVVQVLNAAGAVDSSSPTVPGGRTLLWADDFSGGLSASVTGARTTYGAAKPEPSGTSQFGDSEFADPSSGAESANLGTVAGGFLRMRLSPRLQESKADGAPAQVGALISSSAVGGGGTSAQYGFFEARILGAPGLGTWPAFWMLSNPTLVTPGAASGEIDAVELYGKDTTHACHSVHSYTTKQGTTRCLPLDGRADWTLQWHTYGVDVAPDATRFYVDGNLVTTEKGPSNSADPYFFLLNLASGGGWPVDLSPTQGVSDMYVDWVRVYT